MEPQIVSECLRFCIAELSLLFLPPPLPLAAVSDAHDSPGRYVEEHPGWVKIDHPNGYWMPVMQHGKAVMHEVVE